MALNYSPGQRKQTLTGFVISHCFYFMPRWSWCICFIHACSPNYRGEFNLGCPEKAGRYEGATFNPDSRMQAQNVKMTHSKSPYKPAKHSGHLAIKFEFVPPKFPFSDWASRWYLFFKTLTQLSATKITWAERNPTARFVSIKAPFQRAWGPGGHILPVWSQGTQDKKCHSMCV